MPSGWLPCVPDTRVPNDRRILWCQRQPSPGGRCTCTPSRPSDRRVGRAVLRGSDIRRLAELRRPADWRAAMAKGTPILDVRFQVHPSGWRMHLWARPALRLPGGRIVPVGDPFVCDSTRLRGGQRYAQVALSVARRVCPVTRDVEIRIRRVTRR